MKKLSIAALKKLAKEKGYTLLSWSAYDELKARARPEYVPTAAERRAIERSQRNALEGKAMTLAQVRHELGA